MTRQHLERRGLFAFVPAAAWVLAACGGGTGAGSAAVLDGSTPSGEAGGGSSSGASGDASGGSTPDAAVANAEASGGKEASAELADASGDAATEAGSDGGAPGCAGLVCEDFETGEIDPGKWTTLTDGGTLLVQQQMVAHGKYALQVHGLDHGTGPNGDDWALLAVKNVPTALTGTTTFGRVYSYFTTAVDPDLHIQFIFAGHNGTGPNEGPPPFPKLRYDEVGSYFGTWQLGFDILDETCCEEVSYTKNQLPTGTWYCLEWEFDDEPDSVTAWVNGTQASIFNNSDVGCCGAAVPDGGPIYNGMDSDILGGYDTFGFGMHDWHPNQTFDIYYDDLVLGSTRVGCLP